MSGHSKWATTKHKKAAVDAKRSKLFSKLSRVITVAAKTGGDPKPENNASLAAAIAKAKSYSLPKDKIQSAIDKAFSSAGGANYEEVVYEGYGSHGVAVYVEALTDNRNRTAGEVRHVFTRFGGNLGAALEGFVEQRVRPRRHRLENQADGLHVTGGFSLLEPGDPFLEQFGSVLHEIPRF